MQCGDDVVDWSLSLRQGRLTALPLLALISISGICRISMCDEVTQGV